MEDKKRLRDTESDSVESSKRIRDDSLDVDSFMIFTSPESSDSPVPVSGEPNPYLAHLLEASDDELGLPPRGVSRPDANWADELNQMNEVSCDSFELKDRPVGCGGNADVYVGDSLDYPLRFCFADSVDYCDMPYRFEPLSESSDSDDDSLVIILNDPRQ